MFSLCLPVGIESRMENKMRRITSILGSVTMVRAFLGENF